jgi:Organic solute transport protein 1
MSCAKLFTSHLGCNDLRQWRCRLHDRMLLVLCSMDKLFDLVVMGSKLQVVASSSPAETLDITLHHLRTLRGLLRRPAQDTAVPDCLSLLDSFSTRLQDTFQSVSQGTWGAMRRIMLEMYDERMVKVCLWDALVAYKQVCCLRKCVPRLASCMHVTRRSVCVSGLSLHARGSAR